MAKQHVQIVASLDGFERLVDEWSDLCDHAANPNPFYRPELLLPALRMGLPKGRTLAVAVRSPAGDLAGMFPLQTKRKRLTVCRPLTHLYCFLETPLVRKGFEDIALSGLAQALHRRALPSAVLQIDGLGPNDQRHRELIRTVGLATLPTQICRRPVLRAGQRLHPSNRTVKEYSRKWRRLEEQGTLRLESVGGGQPGFCRRLNQFVDLEHGGWKARHGSSMKSAGIPRQYFEKAVIKAAHRDIWVIDSLCLNDRPIAMQLNLIERSDRTSVFGFKSAFDERLERYSPGVVLLNEQRRRFHELSDMDLFDSCAGEDNLAVFRLWPDRLERSRYYLATNNLLGRAYLEVISRNLGSEESSDRSGQPSSLPSSMPLPQGAGIRTPSAAGPTA